LQRANPIYDDGNDIAYVQGEIGWWYDPRTCQQNNTIGEGVATTQVTYQFKQGTFDARGMHAIRKDFIAITRNADANIGIGPAIRWCQQNT